MTRVTPPEDDDYDAAAQRVIALVQLVLQTRPSVVLEIERTAHHLVAEDVTEQVIERTRRLPPDDVALLECITEFLDQRQWTRKSPHAGVTIE